MPVPKFSETILQKICDILADTSTGLTGSEIGKLLSRLSIEDGISSTKRHRLFEALNAKQNRDNVGNYVIAFIQEAMNPVNFTDSHDYFEQKQDELNKVLAFAGMELGDDGKIRGKEVAKTLSEAEIRSKRLKNELQRRNVHPDILKFCKAELLQNNYFHAVFEATKSIADKIREKSGLDLDGTKLAIEAFEIKKNLPILAFNSLETSTEKNEHIGLLNIIKGVFGAFRNVTSHIPKIKWHIDEQDALDLLSSISLIHRRLDKAVNCSAFHKN
ncbi:TPA: TIGR02391 family protein [Legionella pneumophila]|uniref:TIGR02391 family protein n=1 Tax=Legionella pneumophila TaxID=446 RepID=UPI000787541A|nr:TIGR02391 family protein [Legionella pneumophila]HAU1193390.1 TIGR02391 family protein [Legionella pneumophila]HBD7102797.1 TIGR02391 family protein [Legionella pneumophila]HCO4740218.1 TIGR02391 family protein [Legionella pneumophila]HEG4430787.1 TIGR02391 family protein [Legionella pneumophila]HEG4433174.1 TIGR02391 family protein [Legionella pneumophila]